MASSFSRQMWPAHCHLFRNLANLFNFHFITSQAVSFDKKCNVRIGELLLAEKKLQEQIQHLEHKEKEGVEMLKKADCLWSCMEEAYKKKVAESQERQNVLLKQVSIYL